MSLTDSSPGSMSKYKCQLKGLCQKRYQYSRTKVIRKILKIIDQYPINESMHHFKYMTNQTARLLDPLLLLFYSQLEDQQTAGAKLISLTIQKPFHFNCFVGALFHSDQTNTILLILPQTSQPFDLAFTQIIRTNLLDQMC